MVRKRNSQRSSCPAGWLQDGIKLPVHLTVRQGQYAARAVGIARSVFNLMVATHRSARAQVHGLWPSPMELEKIFNELKHEPEFGMEYATEVSKFVAQGACRDFRRADENWRNPTLNAERPTFQKKNRSGTGSFLAASGVDRVKYDDHRRIRLPYLGSVKLQRELPEGIPYEVRIKQENGRWYASVNYWKPPVGAEEKTHLCGAVDVGITPLAVDSELVHYENPKALYRMLPKLQRWQRTLARRTVGSRGWHAAQGRINAIHRRSNGLRDNAHHQVSRQLVRKYAVLAIESLNVAGMDQLPRQARSIRDAAISGLLQKIRYKAAWYGTIIVAADRFYPSSKLCSDCGAHHASLGRELHWTCPQCGRRHDRNENAALNLLTLAINAARELGKLAPGPVGPNVTLLDGKALANGSNAGGETGPGGRENCLVDAGIACGRRWGCPLWWQPIGSGYQHPVTAGYLIIAYIPDNPYGHSLPGRAGIRRHTRGHEPLDYAFCRSVSAGSVGCQAVRGTGAPLAGSLARTGRQSTTRLGGAPAHRAPHQGTRRLRGRTGRTSGGTRSEQGTERKMTLASTFGTWRAQGLNPLAACRQLLVSPRL